MSITCYETFRTLAEKEIEKNPFNDEKVPSEDFYSRLGEIYDGAIGPQQTSAILKACNMKENFMKMSPELLNHTKKQIEKKIGKGPVYRNGAIAEVAQKIVIESIL